MSTKLLTRRFLRTSLMSGVAVAAVATPALAQDEPEDTIIVTGSRLNQANLTSSSPVFQVDAGEVDTRGTARIEDLINVLPQVIPAQGSGLANGASGTSSLDLRGLGAARTLVLLDGKRLPFGSPQFSPVNLDLIPAQLVERVDVVTGGGSAVYGSDAISGVVNFVTRKDFEGFEIDGQVGFFQDGNGNDFANQLNSNFGVPNPDAALDGRGVNISALFGANTADGRGNVTAFIQYQDQNEIRQGERDYSACAFGTSSSDPRAVGGVTCAGSSTFRRLGLSDDNDEFPAGLFLADDGSLVPFTGDPDQLFNFAPDNFIQRNNERFNINASARYELVDNVEAYIDLGYTTNETDSQIAFSGTFFRNFQINCDNPFLQATVPGGGTAATELLECSPAQIAAGDDVNFGGTSGPGFRNVNGDPRSSFIGLQTFRAVGGLRGTIDDNWSWETFGQFSRTTLTDISTGDLNFDRLQDSFFVVDNGSGPECRSGAAGCTPIDLFGSTLTDGSQAIPRDVALASQGTGISVGSVEQIVLGGTIGGDTGFGTPWTDNNVQALVGVEYRRDNLESTPDELSQIPGGLGLTGVGGGTLPVAGEVEVTEVFFETQIPIVEGRQFFEELSINGAFRFSDYSTDGNGVANSFNAETFAAGLAWAPVEDLRFRGQFQRAIRAPNVINLFTGQNTGLFNGTDPCSNLASNGGAPTATLAQCANTGVTAAQFGTLPDNPAGQLNQVTGGNPFLVAETANTYTFGLLFQPRWVDGFSLAVDYYDISIDDAIGTVPANTSLSQCLNTGSATFCDNVVRDQDGSLFASPVPPAGSPFQFAGVQATNANIANISTRGIDVNARYSFDVSNYGSLAFDYVGTYVVDYTFTPVPGVTDELQCEGLYRSPCEGGPLPEYRHRLLTTWQTPWDVDALITWRHIGSTQFEEAAVGGSASAGGAFLTTGNILDDFLDAANYVDLALRWQVKDNFSMRAGVNNILGRDPELSTEAGTAPGNGDTFPQFYDPAGRFIFVGFNWSL